MKTTEKTHSLLIPHLKHNAERSIIKYHIVELTLHLCIKSMVCWYMGHTGLRVPFWQRRTICRLWLPSGHENPCHNIHETCLWRQKWSNHDIRVESAYKSSILLIYLWSCDVWKKAGVLYSLLRVLASAQRVAAWESPALLHLTSFELHVGIP